MAAVVPAGIYSGYMGYYSQQPVPNPLMPTPGLFGNPPFFPPSTLPDQTYRYVQCNNTVQGCQFEVFQSV